MKKSQLAVVKKSKFYNAAAGAEFLQRFENAMASDDAAFKALELKALKDQVKPAYAGKDTMLSAVYSSFVTPKGKAMSETATAGAGLGTMGLGAVAAAAFAPQHFMAIMFIGGLGSFLPVFLAAHGFGELLQKRAVPKEVKAVIERLPAALAAAQSPKLESVENSPHLGAFLEAFPDVAADFNRTLLERQIRDAVPKPQLPPPVAKLAPPSSGQ